MPQRLALAAASVVATIVLTVGLVAAGFGPMPDPGGLASATSDEAAAIAAEQKLEPEVVYIKPAPTPKTIVLKKKAKASKAAKAGSTKKSRAKATAREREDRDDREDRDEERSERQKQEREKAEERRKKAAERAKEDREDGEEDEDDDD